MRTVTLVSGSEESALCVMLADLLESCAQRHGGRLPGLGSRIGVDAQDAGAQATLVFGGGRVGIEDGLAEPDLVVVAGTDLIPQVPAVPLVLGLPWLLSEAGQRLFTAALFGELRVRGLRRVTRAPLRTTRAAIDLLQLLRLLAGGA